MPDETQPVSPDETDGVELVVIDLVRDAVREADDRLMMLAGVQIAGTQAARNALRDTRLAVLERLLADVRAAVGLEAPVAPGQTSLEVGS